MPFGDLGGFGGFGGFGRDPFASMFNMDMNNMGGNSYCYSSTYSSSSGPDGMIYESSKSTRRGPGGVRCPFTPDSYQFAPSFHLHSNIMATHLQLQRGL